MRRFTRTPHTVMLDIHDIITVIDLECEDQIAIEDIGEGYKEYMLTMCLGTNIDIDTIINLF